MHSYNTHDAYRFGWQTPEVQAEARRRFNGHYADVDDHTILPSEYSTPVYQVQHLVYVCYWCSMSCLLFNTFIAYGVPLLYSLT
jgi:hypothetical protein